jgi:hypothetical protein
LSILIKLLPSHFDFTDENWINFVSINFQLEQGSKSLETISQKKIDDFLIFKRSKLPSNKQYNNDCKSQKQLSHILINKQVYDMCFMLIPTKLSINHCFSWDTKINIFYRNRKLIQTTQPKTCATSNWNDSAARTHIKN